VNDVKYSTSTYMFVESRPKMIKSFKIDPGTTVNLNSVEPSFHSDEVKNDRRLTAGVIRLSSAQLMALIEGMDWRRVRVREAIRPTSVG